MNKAAEAGRLAGKVTIVTGATKGIGRVIAARMASEGASVVLCGRTTARGEAMAAGIKDAGGEAIFVAADIGNENDVKAVVQTAIDTYGPITTLVNNAAATDVIAAGEANIVDVELDAWERLLRVTLTGTMLMSKHVIASMVDAGAGSIVHISSEASYRPQANMAAYPAAKAGVNSLSRSIATDFGHKGIRSNVIIPGMILPPKAREKFQTHPTLGPKLRAQHLTRPGTREDIAAGVVFLASDEAGFITGTELVIDGGSTIMSNLISTDDLFGRGG